MSTEHSPLPWSLAVLKWDDWGWIKDARGDLAAVAKGHDNKEDDQHRVDGTDPYAANAAFIVKAVNAHEDLVKALEDLLTWGSGEYEVRTARAALALAKGE